MPGSSGRFSVELKAGSALAICFTRDERGRGEIWGRDSRARARRLLGTLRGFLSPAIVIIELTEMPGAGGNGALTSEPRRSVDATADLAACFPCICIVAEDPRGGGEKEMRRSFVRRYWRPENSCNDVVWV